MNHDVDLNQIKPDHFEMMLAEQPLVDWLTEPARHDSENEHDERTEQRATLRARAAC